MDKQEQIDTLNEVRLEISRINRAAGRTVFNPAATEALDEMIKAVEVSS